MWTSAQIVNGFDDGPLANAVNVDTGQLPAGTYDIFASISYNGTGVAQGHFELQHRNAANAATLAVLLDLAFAGIANSGNLGLSDVGYVIAANERLRVQVLASNFSGGLSGVIGFRIRPIP